MTDYTADAPSFEAWAGYGPNAAAILVDGGSAAMTDFRAAANAAIAALIADGAEVADAIASYGPEDVARDVLAVHGAVLSEITWDMLADAGIDIGLVEINPTGRWYSYRSPGLHVDFGPAETETGAHAFGWDVTSYVPAQGSRDDERFDHFETATAALAYVAGLVTGREAS